MNENCQIGQILMKTHQCVYAYAVHTSLPGGCTVQLGMGVKVALPLSLLCVDIFWIAS